MRGELSIMVDLRAAAAGAVEELSVTSCDAVAAAVELIVVMVGPAAAVVGDDERLVVIEPPARAP
jgi:hypothetical protein